MEPGPEPAAAVPEDLNVERVQSADGTEVLQLQYSQTALLDFGGMSWPHVTVGTLIRAF